MNLYLHAELEYMYSVTACLERTGFVFFARGDSLSVVSDRLLKNTDDAVAQRHMGWGMTRRTVVKIS